MTYKAVVVGASAGGMQALRDLLIKLPKNFAAPIMIVQHLSPESDGYMAKYLNEQSSMEVKEADDKEEILFGRVYIAPPNYHLLVEKDQTLSFTVGNKVNYARPSIDVLFETAADLYQETLIGIILTGANSDGSKGLKVIKDKGGITIVQDPDTALIDSMPKAAINATSVDYVLSVDQISDKLIELVGLKNETAV
nr:chemotaxis protein CheB [Tissierella sp.]